MAPFIIWPDGPMRRFCKDLNDKFIIPPSLPYFKHFPLIIHNQKVFFKVQFFVFKGFVQSKAVSFVSPENL